MGLKVYKLDKKCFSIGVFDGDELQKGSSPRYYKTKKGAERALKKRLKEW